ncbi:MAG TPA: hypothetical protein VGG27_06755 [Magnetospirillaceae bacterium]|jgi:hypothetical protein
MVGDKPLLVGSGAWHRAQLRNALDRFFNARSLHWFTKKGRTAASELSSELEQQEAISQIADTAAAFLIDGVEALCSIAADVQQIRRHLEESARDG